MADHPPGGHPAPGGVRLWKAGVAKVVITPELVTETETESEEPAGS